MKKFLSLIIVALMLVSILPLAAFAAGDKIASDFDIEADCLTAKTVKLNSLDLDACKDYVQFTVTVKRARSQSRDVKIYPVFEETMSATDYVFTIDDNETNAIRFGKNQYEKEVTVKIFSKKAVKTNVLFTTVDPASTGAFAEAAAPVTFKKTTHLEAFRCNTHDGGVAYAEYFEDVRTVNCDQKGEEINACAYSAISSPSKKVAKVNYKDCDDNVVGGEEAVFEVEFGEVEDTLTLKKTTARNAKIYANGQDSHELTATVKNLKGDLMKGVEVTFTVKDGSAYFENGTVTTKATTDAKTGKAVVKLYSKTPGTVKVKAECGDASKELSGIEFITTGVVKVLAESEDNQKIALDGKVELKYSFYDAMGNKVKYSKPNNNVLGNLKDKYKATITVEKQPSLAKLTEKDFTVSAKANGTLVLSYENFKFEGDYQVKLQITNGNAVVYNFNVKKAGAAVSMKIAYDTVAVQKEISTTAPDVTYYDAEGYKVKLTDPVERFAVSSAAIAFVDATTGVLTGREEGTVTVTVYNDAKGLSASTTMVVGKNGDKLVCKAPTSASVNELVEVAIQLVDVDGNAVAGPALDISTAAKALFVSKPANAVVSALSFDDEDDDWHKKGTANLTFTAYTEGTYDIVVTIGSYSGTVSVVVGKNNAFNAACVFMLGSDSYMAGGVAYAGTSVAYADANNRTMLGFRDLGNAIGATVKYEDGVATLVKAGKTVTAAAGNKYITVDGTQVAIDTEVVNKDGRLMLPFRAIFEAFGYKVSYSNGVIICK